MTISHLPQTTAQNMDVLPVSSQDPMLYRIAELLGAIANQPAKSEPLGFVQPPRPTWIYANRTQGDRWYWRTPTGEYELCPTAALSGRLVKLEFREVTRRQQPVWKLWATLEADRTYIIEAGKDSVFSKSLLSAISVLQPADLNNVVTIEVCPADQNQESMFCNFYLGGDRIYRKWGEDPDWNDIAQKAMMLVNQDASAMSQTMPNLPDTNSSMAETAMLMEG
ncbi:MAG: hypothetical protein AAGD25_22835 [Cyanobacteria bacterium P01_F01_bin.150]